MKPFDMGEIIGGYTYVRTLYPSKMDDGSYLIIHPTLFSNLSSLTNAFGYFMRDNMGVNVKLLDSKNEKYKTEWIFATAKKSHNQTIMLGLDRVAGIQIADVVLATIPWMEEFGASEGNRVVLKAPVPKIEDNNVFSKLDWETR